MDCGNIRYNEATGFYVCRNAVAWIVKLASEDKSDDGNIYFKCDKCFELWTEKLDKVPLDKLKAYTTTIEFHNCNVNT